MELYAYEREHLKKLRKYLAECTVLLKTNGDFPLEAPGLQDQRSFQGTD